MRYNHYLYVREKQTKRRQKKAKPLRFTKLFNYWYPKGQLMYIDVSGRVSKKLKEELYNAAEYYASLLLPRSIAKDIYLELKIKNKLEHGHEGYCSFEDKDNNNRDFLIELQKKSDEELLLNLAHEMVHLKQFAMGELGNGAMNTHARWQDIYYIENNATYWDSPWEIEAYGRERGLYSRYCEALNKARQAE